MSVQLSTLTNSGVPEIPHVLRRVMSAITPLIEECLILLLSRFLDDVAITL
ncbi:MAG: hypothetical protein WBF33_13020 [Candidatus Nitrosopolaris sp.]